MTLQELAAASALVFVGTIEAVDINAGDGRRPLTRVALDVQEVLTGSVDRQLEFFLPEGTLADGRFVSSPQTPKFTVGETYLVFYRAGPWSVTPVVGGTQGYARMADIGGRHVFVNHRGRGITAITADGLHSGPTLADTAAQRDLNARSALPNRQPTSSQRMLATTCVEATTLLGNLRAVLREMPRAEDTELERYPTIIPISGPVNP
jgi:hypothetical protein